MEGRQRFLPPILDQSTSDLQAPTPFSSSTDQHPDRTNLRRFGSRASLSTTKSMLEVRSTSSRTKSAFSDFVNAMPTVQCPLCSEIMDNPKLLSCLHSICKKCLQTHILTEVRDDLQKDRPISCFHCPVCEETIPAPVPDHGCEKWAAQYPTHFFLHAYGMLMSVLRGEVDCDPCHRRGEATLATWWCCECSEYQCNVCKTVHGGFKAFKHHGVIPTKEISDNPDLAMPRFEPCKEHREKITKYCRDHRQACCGICLATTHRKCEHIVTIDKQFETSVAKGDIGVLVDLLKNYETMASEINDFRTRILLNVETRKKEIAESIQQIREGFEKDLKQLEDNLLKDLEMFHRKEVEKLTYLKNDSENLLKKISNALSLVEAVNRFGSRTHVVTTMDKVIPVCDKYDRNLKRAQDDLKNISYIFEIDPLLANVFRTISSFGKVSVSRTDQPPQNLTITKPDHHGKVAEVKRVHVALAGDRGRCGIMGGAYLSDGRILLADYDNFKLKLFHESSRLLGKLVLKGKPSDLEVIEDNACVVTYPSASGMQFIDLSGNVLKEGKYINTQRIYHGVSLCDKKLYFVANSGIAIYDMDGNEQGFIKVLDKNVSLFRSPRHIKVTPNVLFVTDTEKNSVFALSPTGKLLYTINSKDMTYPFGLDLDSYGDVYVCCKRSSNVHHVTATGKKVDVLLTEKDGLQSPLLIHFQKFTSKFFVTQSKGQDRDHIIIYQFE